MLRATRRRLVAAAAATGLAGTPAAALAVTRDGTRLPDTLRGTPAADILRGPSVRSLDYGIYLGSARDPNFADRLVG